MSSTVKVRLRKPARVFTFLCKNIELRREDACIVRSDRGLEYGVCVLPPEEAGPDAKDRYKMSVVRRATDHDKMTHRQIQDDERRAKETCREKIRAAALPMKLVECEYSFDRRKIIFYFTADDRVDFRRLVRDLARDLKARIELRHIQVRDEAKIVGGIGTCGRELCCTTWMKEFMPISMRMAKRQNLSLNPSKISGQCGRLMCCLSYENEMYAKQKKAAQKPKPAELEDIRDKMEGDAANAVETLKRTSLSDVDAPAAEQADRTQPADRGRPPAQADDKPDATAEEQTSAETSGKRRRRRRGRRGRRGGGNSGGAAS